MRQQITGYLHNAIFAIILAIAALTPLIFSPLTTEAFETPKIIFLVVATIALLILWSASWVTEGRVVITRTPLDLPLLLILAVILVSTFFSETRYVAIFGNLPRIHGSAVTWVTYILLYFIISSNLKSITQIRAIIYTLLGSSTIAALVALLSYFGVYLPLPFAKALNFTPAGSSFSAAALLVMMLPLLLSSIIKENKTIPTPIALGLSALFGLTIALIGNVAIWSAAALVVLLTAFVTKKEALKRTLPLLAIPVGITIVIVALSFVPLGNANPLFEKRQNFPRELQLEFDQSWKISASAFRDNPFLGSGPASYLFNFTQYKPAEYNSARFWNIRFDTPHNEYLLFLGTLGGLGLMALVFFTALIINFAWRGMFHHENNLATGLSIAALASIVLMAMHVTTPVMIMGMLLILAMLMAVYKHVTGKVDEFSIGIKASKVRDQNMYDLNSLVVADILPIILIIPILIFVAWVGFQTYKAVLADYYHRMALNSASTRALDTYNFLVKAENLNPYVDLYRVDLAQTNFALANGIAAAKGPNEASAGGSLTDEDKKNIQTLLSQAIAEARNGVALSPRNAANWEVLASIYRQISGVAQNALAFSLDSYGRAILLDPLNPLLRLNVGGVYYSVKNYDLAIRFFDDAVKLKPDYANAYYNLAIALRDKGNTREAQLVAERVVTLLQKDTENPDYKVAAEFLAGLKEANATGSAQPNVAGAQTQVPPAAEQNGALQQEGLPNVLDEELNAQPQIATPPAVRR